MATKKEIRAAVIDLIESMRQDRAEKRILESQISDTQTEAVSLMKKRLKAKSVSYDHDEFKVVGTLVEPTSLILDEVKLKKKVGAKNWNRVTKRILDRSLLEQAVSEGFISPEIVAACATEEPKNPYIRITEKQT